MARDLVEKTLPHLPPTVSDLIRIQMLTGMRSGEVTRIRPCNIERGGEVWWFRLAEHKTAHHGQARVVALGPKAQQILLPLLEVISPEEYIFSPTRAEGGGQLRRSEKRKTPRWPSHMARNRRKRKSQPARAPKDRYTATALGRCVARACERAFPLPGHLAAGNGPGDRRKGPPGIDNRMGAAPRAAGPRRG